MPVILQTNYQHSLALQSSSKQNYRPNTWQVYGAITFLEAYPGLLQMVPKHAGDCRTEPQPGLGHLWTGYIHRKLGIEEFE
jgi:hypothetical protein